jgi:mannose-6-phosphate isomerase-like protein (cupin superfamily)
MRFHRVLTLIEVGLTLSASACQSAPRSTPPPMVPPTPIGAPTPEVLELDQGERFVRRGSSDSTSVSILKVDGRNGGSPDLVMGYERLAPGRTIMPHRHLLADEIIFVHEGSGIAEVGELKKSFGTGATIYIPRNVRVSVHNTGSVPLAIAFFFSKPGFDAYLRDTSVPSGQPITPMSSEELAAIRARHRWHVVYEQP